MYISSLLLCLCPSLFVFCVVLGKCEATRLYRLQSVCSIALISVEILALFCIAHVLVLSTCAIQNNPKKIQPSLSLFLPLSPSFLPLFCSLFISPPIPPPFRRFSLYFSLSLSFLLAHSRTRARTHAFSIQGLDKESFTDVKESRHACERVMSCI